MKEETTIVNFLEKRRKLNENSKTSPNTKRVFIEETLEKTLMKEEMVNTSVHSNK